MRVRTSMMRQRLASTRYLACPEKWTCRAERIGDVFPEADFHKEVWPFYVHNYRRRFTFDQVDFASQAKRILRGSQPWRCRFCGQGVPKVTFWDVAHAVPESIGNRPLI